MVDRCGSSSRLSYYTSTVSPREGVYHSYDCDWSYSSLPGYPVALITTGGCVIDAHGFCGFLCLLAHTHAVYAGLHVGACLMIVIISQQVLLMCGVSFVVAETGFLMRMGVFI